MAEDTTVESPSVGDGEQSLEDLRQTLADKQKELEGLRAQRVKAQQDSVDRVQKAQLEKEIARVDALIDAEQVQLDIQLGLDPKQVGTGVPTEGEPLPPEPVDPSKLDTDGDGNLELQTLKYGEVAQVGPPPTEDHSDDDDDTPEGDEN